MPKYLCITKCFVAGKLYKQENVYEFAEKPNEHFVPLGKEKPVTAEKKKNLEMADVKVV